MRKHLKIHAILAEDKKTFDVMLVESLNNIIPSAFGLAYMTGPFRNNVSFIHGKCRLMRDAHKPTLFISREIEPGVLWLDFGHTCTGLVKKIPIEYSIPVKEAVKAYNEYFKE